MRHQNSTDEVGCALVGSVLVAELVGRVLA